MAKKKIEEPSKPISDLGFGIGRITIGHSIVWNQYEEINLENLQLQIGWEFQGEKKSGEINIQLIVKYFLDKEEKISLMVNNHYFVTHPEILEKESVAGLPVPFLRTLVNLSIGTARGILAQTTAGTFWGDYPLPIQNIAEIVPDGTKKFLS